MHAEAFTVKKALFLAEQRGIGRIVLETDCRNLIAAVKFNACNSSSLGTHLLAANDAGESHGFHATWELGRELP